jgi:hypothetical protein
MKLEDASLEKLLECITVSVHYLFGMFCGESSEFNLLYLTGGKCKVRALNGQCCILPFTYKGRVYNNCTRAESEEAWCAVRLPFFGNETNWRQNCTSKLSLLLLLLLFLLFLY